MFPGAKQGGWVVCRENGGQEKFAKSENESKGLSSCPSFHMDRAN